MPGIYPKITRAKLKSGARRTAASKSRVPLPGVKTDAKDARATDKCGYMANRELAAMIRAAVKAKKKSDKHGAHFVLGWRLYPNAAHPRWKGGKNEHACGCGCGCG